jgi:hypothetical protein
MINKINRLKILVILLALGITVIGNLEAQTDNRLIGTWVQFTESFKFEIKLGNGTFEEMYNDISFRKGTYTTRNSRELTIAPTHIHGGGFNYLMSGTGVDFGMESKWYTFNDFIITVRARLLKMGVSEREAQEFVETAVSSNTTSTYSVDGTSLILTSTFQGQSFVVILTKK